ncbi:MULTISPECIES: phosphoadenylyl-sulfate reductase [unclassified Agarivorans]|uniref:phosphoadenylyl-sulfate reductase n=1 Tax=unclassified Agarivorans TaxID=2636026 RepID=UPI0026E25F6F|nr:MULTISPECIES: phosphoadenylyl-sulfate reductase [unclassified Agarivorans]MDO6687714.1 phosphoadenylyl-sulfate reductase [Agarivorans sp. 3_MG-2023]MDO6717285.1 phosphoadenylyl-sulfate reductase [Agarivorans sp. 2_MG-2023]
MTNFDLEQLAALPVEARIAELSDVNKELEGMTAQQRAAWALDNLPQQVVLTSSFGIQAAVSLHMLTQIKPDIPVILTDTGYLFPETYRFIDELASRLNLNLKVYKSQQSNAWQEARFGKLWEQGVEGLKQYNTLNKVEPMQRAFKELEVRSWFSGLRRSQSSTRTDLPVLQIQNGAFKVLPIIDWTNKDVHYYLKEHNLPYHPLWEEGYVSVGDVQTSQPLQAGMTEEDTRFFGLKRECGIHEEVAGSGI